jgi:hypothetical protein
MWDDESRELAYQSPLENSLALRLALRGERGVADTAALKATMVAKRDEACMVMGARAMLLRSKLGSDGAQCVLSW